MAVSVADTLEGGAVSVADTLEGGAAAHREALATIPIIERQGIKRKVKS